MRAFGIPHDKAPADVSAIDYVRCVVIPAALSMLPPRMDSIEARAMLVAIGMQESRFKTRRQEGGGPARSLWQGEPGGGMSLIFTHPATQGFLQPVLKRMAYAGLDPNDPHALEHNDILSCVRARLLLWTYPKPLPEGDPVRGWQQYIELWRPGKERRESWDAFYLDAWARECA